MKPIQGRPLVELPIIRVQVVEPGRRARQGWIRCEIGSNLSFNVAKMESYFFAEWRHVLYDALVVAASIEFCDKTRRRPASGWGREIHLRITVHEPDRWNQRDVTEQLVDTLNFLTGDQWDITFYGRHEPESAPRQRVIRLEHDVSAVIPFSNGLDSRAVAGIEGQVLRDSLVRVHLGSTSLDPREFSRHSEPFTAVPYKVRAGEHKFVESSVRSRGFKFALISGLAAHLAKANRVLVPESGQGALGPALVPVGQAYPDYRNHPLFTARMEKLLSALLDFKVHFEFPRLWRTKGETLSQFVTECKEPSSSWESTWSCWQDNRQVSVDKRKRQCGVCAACMLRRLSVHAAGLKESKCAYVWEDLGAPSFDRGASAAFDRKKIMGVMRDYAIAGTLHLKHLAEIGRSPLISPSLSINIFQLASVCDLSEKDLRSRLGRLLRQHATEWENFVNSLGPNSFVADWAGAQR